MVSANSIHRHSPHQLLHQHSILITSFPLSMSSFCSSIYKYHMLSAFIEVLFFFLSGSGQIIAVRMLHSLFFPNQEIKMQRSKCLGLRKRKQPLSICRKRVKSHKREDRQRQRYIMKSMNGFTTEKESNTFVLNGVYLIQFLSFRGEAPHLVQNIYFSTSDL